MIINKVALVTFLLPLKAPMASAIEQGSTELSILPDGTLAWDDSEFEVVQQRPLSMESASTSSNGATCYDFDNLIPGTYTEAQLSTPDVTFDNTGGSSFDVRVVCPNVGADFTCANAIINRPFTTLGNKTRATFSSPVSSVSVVMGDFGSDADNIFLNAYDSSGNLVDSAFFAIPGGNNSGPTLTVSATNIAYVEFYGVGINNNSVFWDNFCFSSSDTNGSKGSKKSKVTKVPKSPKGTSSKSPKGRK